MSGGHFNQWSFNRKKYVCLPKLKKSGRDTIVPFFRRITRFDSSQSNDPLLVTKPITAKVEGQKHETDRLDLFILTLYVMQFI